MNSGHVRKIYPFSILMLGIFCTFVGKPSFALNPGLKKSVYFETNANGAMKKSDQSVKMFHYEIPLFLLEEDKSFRVPSEIYNSLVFEKNGNKYVRWIVNPEDTEWHLQVKKFLDSNHIPSNKSSYFVGYPTASRSWIVEDPKSGAVFSVKTSTNRLAKKEAAKIQPWQDTSETRQALDYITERNKITPFENFSIFDEPLGFGVKSLDMGMLVRTLGDANTDEFIYMPAFAALHQSEGKKIALANGFKNAEQFWNENLNKPLARAMAEFYAKTGAVPDSTHSQNFVVQLDKNLKPTGKIIFRDVGDIRLHLPAVNAMGGQKLLKIWPAESKIYSKVHFGVGLLHLNKPPSWLSKTKYMQWGKDFFKEFEKELTKRTGVMNFPGEPELGDFNYSFHGKEYDTDSEEWKKFRRDLAAKNGEQISVCKKSFSKIGRALKKP